MRRPTPRTRPASTRDSRFVTDDSAAGRWRCPVCSRSYGDPHYHGPPGHAPPRACLDCWLEAWDEIRLRMLADRQWNALDLALLFQCQGFSAQQASAMSGIHRNTLYKYIRAIRAHPELMPEWLEAWIEDRRRYVLEVPR